MILRLVLPIFILLIKSSNCQVASNRVINIQNITQCINPLKDEQTEPMQAPYFLVPIQPDDLDSLNRLIHFDVDSGQVCFLPEFHQVKFTTLSINQGLALNLEINLIDYSSTTTTTRNPPKQINITHVIPKLSHRNSARLVFTCTQSNPQTHNGTRQIDQHLFYIENNDNLNTSNTNFIRLVNSVSQTETNLVIECPNESVEYTYTLRLSAPDENYFLKSSSNQNVVFQLKKPSIQTSSTSTSSSAAHQQITKTAAKLAKLTFNLKIFTILALTLASLLAVLIYIVFLTLTRLMRAKAQIFGGSTGTDSCGTMDTHSSIIMSDLPMNVTSGNCFFKSSRCFQLDMPTSEMFKHSSVYLGQLGIDATANLKHLIDDGGEGEGRLGSLVAVNSSYKPNMYVTNGSAASMDLSGTRACVQQRWQRMLDWNVDFNSMSDVFHDLARFK